MSRDVRAIRVEMAKEITKALSKAVTGRVDEVVPHAERLDDLSRDLQAAKGKS